MRRLFLCMGLALGLAACGGGDAPPPVEPDPLPPPQADLCAVDLQRSSLQQFMQQEYLWHERMGVADPAAPDMDRYFASLLNKPTDRYSYTQSAASYNQVFTFGKRTGYGYTMTRDAASRLRLRNIEPASPAAAAGLRRGDIVLSIDGLTPEQIAEGLLPAVSTAGVARRFRLQDSAGQEREVEVISAEFSLRPLPLATVLDQPREGGGSAKVGYLVLHQFVNYGQIALTDAMRSFVAAGVEEVVLDLRYNGGGSVAFSRQLASFLGGTTTAGELYAGLHYNATQQSRNTDYKFLAPSALVTAPLSGLRRLIVITSGGTASASELLVNGLRPFMPVVLVGENTYGKPYGSVPRNHCGTVYQAMQFDSLNAQGVGGFTSGFAPDCAVPDDLERELGDPQERRLAAALGYIATGSCPAQPQSRALGLPAPPAAPLGETVPPGMFAD